MAPFFSERFGNPSGSHSLARSARQALEASREDLAAALGAGPGEVVFTSGGTEADNLAVHGLEAGPGSVLCSAVEHPAVLEACRATGGVVVGVDRRGVLDLDRLAASLDDRVRLVSVMLVNNETGVRQPLGEVVSLVRERCPEALVHTDAVQGFCWVDLREPPAREADLVTVSAHKFGGPKGAGALVVRERARRLRPLLRGGPQERERRAGTQNVAAAVGMAAAATVVARGRAAVSAQVGELAGRLVDGIVSQVPGVHEAVPRPERVEAICNLGFEGVEAEELLMVLDELGVCASAGSSCASGALEPSHVLTAMGLSRSQARSHIRLSLGPATSGAEVTAALGAFPVAVSRLRGG